MKASSTLFVVLLSAAALSACSSLTFVKGRSWVPLTVAYPRSIAFAYPEVDRQTAAASIEAELARLAPLLFMDYGLPVAEEGRIADCIAEISAVEREYSVGWKTRRSTTLEIVLKRVAQAGGARSERIASSQAQARGTVCLSSSRDLYRLLDKAVRELADGLREASEEK
jgi:hypothetical protein